MHRESPIILLLLRVIKLPSHANLLLNCHPICLASLFYEWPIEPVPVECSEDKGFDFVDMAEEFIQESFLIWLIEDREHANLVLWFRTVFEWLHVSSYNSSIGNEEPSSVKNVGDHHDLIEFGIWEF